MSYNIKFSQSQKSYKVNLGFTLEVMPISLSQLTDVQISGNNYDQYVLVYDSASGKWKDVNPDVVLSAATTVPDANRTTFTLPQVFEDKLDVDLDDKIDLDAGTF
jgi:hypothetical protein